MFIDEKGHLYSFVDMGRRVIGVIDMIDHIYNSNYSTTDIYTKFRGSGSSNAFTCFFFKVCTITHMYNSIVNVHMDRVHEFRPCGIMKIFVDIIYV